MVGPPPVRHSGPRASLLDVIARVPDREAASLRELDFGDGLDLAEQAERHGLSAYVAEGLEKGGVQLPAGAQERLASAARSTVALAQRNRRLLFRALDALVARKVEPIVLKGYGLAARLYPSPLARPSTDVDLLVQPEALDEVHRALGELGLQAVAESDAEDPEDDERHHAFQGPAGLVEVHYRLFSGFGGGSFDEEGIWRRSTLSELERRSVRFLDPTDEFLYLATHAANHAFLRLSWLVDLQLFLRRGGLLDWPAMAERATKSGFSSALATSLVVLEQALGVALPPGAVAASRRRSTAHRRLFSNERLVAADLAQGRLSNFLVRLWLVDSPRRATRHLLGGARRLARRLGSSTGE